MNKPNLGTLGTGTAVLVLGVFLLLQSNGALDLNGAQSLFGLALCVLLALIGSSFSRRIARRDAEPEAEEEDLATAALGREASRISKIGFALGILLGAGLLYVWATGSLEAVGKVALAALVVTIALMLISAPFWLAMVRRLGSERVARARADERSAVAAHLHDSVLQTLALIQKRADDPEQVALLARRQERDLREWLSDTAPSRPDERLSDALRAAAAEIEDSHGAPIEAVVVGDAPLDERLEALVAASREALTNSAKFASKGGPVRLYAEIENGSARVFIDDRGPGFDPRAIPNDRHGVRESIIGRMERYGGKAKIHSEPGDGTEVELTMRARR
ncbi:MAG TPA: ATP-binding protein [Solirubrobacterales bacterium]|nr:ATP-binding protein [Solirubrobacterales bacterium]